MSSGPYALIMKKIASDAMIGPEKGQPLLEKLVRHCFTPDEAELAGRMNFFYKPEPVKTLAKRIGRREDELLPLLEAMADKGVIRAGAKGYALLPILPGIFENALLPGGETPWHIELARIVNELFETGYIRRYIDTPTRVARVIPVEETVEFKNSKVDSDYMSRMIDSHDTMAVLNNCQCRQAAFFVGNECTTASRADGCLVFGSFAKPFLDRGGARPVSKEEMRSIIKERWKNNLVFYTGNISHESTNFICTCCSCCCHMTKQIIRPQPGMILAEPHYKAVCDDSKCIDCGKCLAACSTFAHDMDGRRHTYDPNRCVGCGLCISACPAGALDMAENPAFRKPPKTFKRLVLSLAPAKISAVIKQKLKGN
ncbi:MAG: 4Fe-4S binding protein [Spirochaetia bacterium]